MIPLTQSIKRGCASAALILALATPAALAYPGAGDDRFDSAALVRLTVPALGLQDEAITLAGPTRIRRGDPYDPGDGRLKIDAEFKSLVLQGESSAGPVTVRLIPPSAGCIQQKEPGVDFPADSFFDVRVEIVVQTLAGPATALSDPARPIRMMATINDLPPFDAQYQPEGTFAGVDIVDPQGNVIGTLAHVGHFVGQQPTFSVAPGGPSNLPAADLFKRATSLGIRGSAIGLGASDNIDGLSYGFDFVFPPFQFGSEAFRPAIMDFRFSVAKGSRGRQGSHVQREAAKSPPQAHGDEFRTTPFAGLGGGSNVQMLDEDGDTAPPLPLQIADDLDAITEQPPTYADSDGDGSPQGSVYFSLSAGSPGLGSSSAADILVSTAGGPPTVFLPAASMGLTPADDIDAFCLNTISRSVVFSLTPTSPSLAGASAADLFLSFQTPGTFFPVARAANLGLDPGDDVDALKCHVGEAITLFDGHAQISLLMDGQPYQMLDLSCGFAATTSTHDLEAETENSVSGFIESLTCGEREQIHFTSVAGVFDLFRILFQKQITMDFLARLQLDAIGALSGRRPMHLEGPSFVEPINMTDNPIVLALGGEGEPSQSSVTPYPLFTANGQPTPFAIGAMTITLDNRPRAEFDAERFLDAASFGATPAPGGLATLFVATPTEEAAAGAIPLPRRIGSDVQVLFEVPAVASAITEEGAGPRQQNATRMIPAPLLFANGNQINLQIPWEVDASGGEVNAVVRVNGADSASVPLSIAPTSPGFFTADFGAGRAIAVNPDGTLAQPAGSLGASHPAAAGDTLVLYASGLGATSPPGVTGDDSLNADGSFVRRDVVDAVRVTMGGVEAQVVFAGLSPQFVGVYQLNVTVPAGAPAGDAVPLVLEAGGRASRADVTIAVAAAP